MQEHCSYTTEWLASTLLTKLANWSQQPSINIEMLSLCLVDMESYSVTYQRLKEKYGPYLVSVSSRLYMYNMDTHYSTHWLVGCAPTSATKPLTLEQSATRRQTAGLVI